jgi:hypothetical protein
MNARKHPSRVRRHAEERLDADAGIVEEQIERAQAEAAPERPAFPAAASAEDADALLVGVPLETDAIEVVDDTLPTEAAPVEEEPAYFAPTDPVITSDSHGTLEVLGGFTPTALSDLGVEPPAEEDGGGMLMPGDEALAEAVRRELREDAATTDLHVWVEVEDGVVHLSGRVEGMEDVENAEAVAAAVPGVREVIEELEVATL